MKNLIANLSMQKAAVIVGISFIIMFILALFADAFVLQSLVVPGDVIETTNNIRNNGMIFWSAILAYIIILLLDSIIALGLYVILKTVNKTLSSFAALLRLAYTAVMGISLIALILLLPDEYSYGKLIAYVFFILHVFILGYLVYNSKFILRGLGVFLMIASLCYIILLYGDIILPQELYEILVMIAMVPATFAELTLGFWFLLKRNELSEQKIKTRKL